MIRVLVLLCFLSFQKRASRKDTELTKGIISETCYAESILFLSHPNIH